MQSKDHSKEETHGFQAVYAMPKHCDEKRKTQTAG